MPKDQCHQNREGVVKSDPYEFNDDYCEKISIFGETTSSNDTEENEIQKAKQLIATKLRPGEGKEKDAVSTGIGRIRQKSIG